MPLFYDSSSRRNLSNRGRRHEPRSSPDQRHDQSHRRADPYRHRAVHGFLSNVVDNAILTPILPVANQDPATQVFISALGYYNGMNTLSQPVLPPDLILPLSIAQRQTGSGAQFTPMMPAKGPLMSRIPGPYFGEWEWRNDAINMVGSTNTMDIRVRYEGRLPRISPTANFSLTTINIRDGEDALAG